MLLSLFAVPGGVDQTIPPSSTLQHSGNVTPRSVQIRSSKVAGPLSNKTKGEKRTALGHTLRELLVLLLLVCCVCWVCVSCACMWYVCMVYCGCCVCIVLNFWRVVRKESVLLKTAGTAQNKKPATQNGKQLKIQWLDIPKTQQVSNRPKKMCCTATSFIIFQYMSKK